MSGWLPFMQILAASLAGLYALWVLYLAAVLVIGYLLDCLLNIIVMTVILIELPQELTVTARLKRHHAESTGWRLAVVLWFEPLLDPYDPAGDAYRHSAGRALLLPAEARVRRQGGRPDLWNRHDCRPENQPAPHRGRS